VNARAYLAKIHELGCVVCSHMGVEQSSITEAHHVESVRDSNADFATVALCIDHHRGKNGVHGLGRRGFVTRYGLTDIDLLALTVKAWAKDMR
jgi:predicted class III extradiol MEMO1 family dioxygenase